MSSWLRQIFSRKIFLALLTLSIILVGGSIYRGLGEKSNPKLAKIVVPGHGTFDLASYPFLDRRVIGLVNNLRDFYSVTDMSNESVNDLSMLPPFLTQYFLAFTIYGLSQIVNSVPNYRTDYYKQIFWKLIAMMNSSQMEYIEWIKPGYASEDYADLGNKFRGPTNIMWTGHYALMMLLYYSLFRDPRYNNEIKFYMDQWYNSLTANETWDGRPSNGLGRWGVGLIPCEPYIVFVQCNSIPFYAMRLYDKLHGTNYREASLPGIEWWQKNMMDSNGVPIDGYFVAEPNDEEKAKRSDLPPSFPGPARTRGMDAPKVAAYGSAWIIMFYKAMGYDDLAKEIYGNFKKLFVHYTTDGMAYVVDNYHYPNEFGLYDFIGNLFAIFCAKEMGDWDLFYKLEKWFYRHFPGRWVGDKYVFDTSAYGDLAKFLYPIANFVWAWGHNPSTLTDLMNPKPDSFFTETPYIEDQSRYDGVFVYQAYYDQDRKAFIFTVEVDGETVFTFANFPNIKGVYTVDGEYGNWQWEGNKLYLTVEAGVHSFVIV